MAAGALIGFVLLDRGVEPLHLARLHRVHLGQIAAGLGEGCRQVIAFMPAIDLARPDQVADRAQHRQACPALGSQLAKPGQAVDVRLVQWIGPRGKVHQHRIRPRPAQRQPRKFGAAHTVAHQVAEPQRVRIGEEIRLAHRDRQHRAHVHNRIEIAFQLKQPGHDKVGIGAAKAPVEVNRVAHSEAMSITKRYLTSAFSMRS